MPRITAERQESRRAQIVDAARRCFSATGFHATSMADIAAEAGVSVGTPYRYFPSKEALIVELAGNAFRLIFAPLVEIAAAGDPASAADLIDAATQPVRTDTGTEPAEHAEIDELLRVGVLAWAELLHRPDLGEQAQRGFDQVRDSIALALRIGQANKRVPVAVHPDRAARVVIALLHGFVLQRATFGLDDTAAFTADARALLSDAESTHTLSTPT